MEPPDPDPYSLYSYIFLTGDFNPTVGLLLIIVLIMASALVSGSEVAFFSIDANDREKLLKDKAMSSNRIVMLREHPNRLLATILIANNAINIGIILLTNYVLLGIFPPELFNAWSVGIKETIGLDVAPIVFNFMINTVGITVILVLFGEILPKVYASRNHLRMARITSLPLRFFQTMLWPLSSILLSSTEWIEQRLPGIEGNKSDLDAAIELTVGTDSKDQDEVDILKGILKFQDVSVTQIMKSRMDIIAVDETMAFRDVVDLFKSSGFSRYPVYREELDTIIGILYVKDFIGMMNGNVEDSFPWQKKIREKVLYVPESKNIYDLLRDFQSEKTHLAIIVDEYGGSSGLATLEDVMEEVIGEIQDEFDSADEISYTKLDKYNYIFEGKVLINDICKIMDLASDTFDGVQEDSDSLAGLILEITGYIPRKNQIINCLDFKFKITAANHRRIEEVQITLPKK